MEKENTNIHILELSSYTRPEIVEDSRKEWVTLGEDNSGYCDLINRYKNSTTNGSIINNVSRLCYGKGLDALDSSKKPNDYAVMKSLFKPKMLRSAFLNEYMLGTGYLQLIYNKNHTSILRVETVKTKHIAPEKCNEDGEIVGYYYSDNWEDTRKFPPKRYSAFGTSKDEIEILAFGKESIDLKYFSEVDYQAALPYALLEEEIATYQINDVQNGFAPTMIVNFNNGVPSEEMQLSITKKVTGTLTGSNGKKVLTAFNHNAESKTTLEPIALNDAPDHYQYLSTEAQQKILNGHCVISPFLVGITPEGSGFSSSADEIEVATKTYYNQTIKPHQELLLDALDTILAFNGIALKMYFKNLNLLDLIGEEPKEEELSVKMSHWLEAFGEDETEDWNLIDSRDVDYDTELELDSQFANWGHTSLKKVLLATGIASPNRPSNQDREIDGFYFKVRYKYVGNESPERGFCKDMMKAAKVYRKEDIVRMGESGINKSQGHDGANMDIWKFKGGVACMHKWERRTYVSANKTASIGSAKTNQVSTGKARKFGYNPINEKEVSVKPHDMPDMGRYPNK